MLTPSQLDIVQHPFPPNSILAVNAGPGSGKTLTIATRVAELLKTLDFNEVLVLSMTNRAVNEFKSALNLLIGDKANHVHISTFHSFSANIVDQHMVKKRRLLDDLTWKNLTNFFVGLGVDFNGKRINTKVTPAALGRILDDVQSGNRTIEEVSKMHNINKEYIIEVLNYLEKHGIIRYSQLITDAVEILQTTKVPVVARYKVVVIDEFQDMHKQLLHLVRAVVSHTNKGFEDLKDESQTATEIEQYRETSRNTEIELEHTGKQPDAQGLTQQIRFTLDDRITEDHNDATEKNGFLRNRLGSDHKKIRIEIRDNNNGSGSIDRSPEVHTHGEFRENNTKEALGEINTDKRLEMNKMNEGTEYNHVVLHNGSEVNESNGEYVSTNGDRPLHKDVPDLGDGNMQTSNALKHLTIAGDSNQSIYEFLGSDPNLMRDISHYFPEYKVECLGIQETFRLTPNILKTAQTILEENVSMDSTQKFSSTKAQSHIPVLSQFPGLTEEIDFIGREITRLILESSGTFKLGDFAILGRTNKEVNQVKTYLSDVYGLECNVYGQTSSWTASKVHLFLDLLSVVNRGAGSDFSLLSCILLLDKRAANKNRALRLFNRSEHSGVPLESVLGFKDFVTIYKNKDTRSAIESFLEATVAERKHLHSAFRSPFEITTSLLNIVKVSGLIEELNREEASSLLSNLSAFYASLKSYHETYANSENPSTASFIDFFLHKFNEDIPVVRETMINVSTIHSAKGLEFPVVFVLGCNANFWNSWSGVYNGRDPQKARLWYVAVTRAKEILYCGSRESVGAMERLFTSRLPRVAEGRHTITGRRLFMQWFPEHMKRGLQRLL